MKAFFIYFTAVLATTTADYDSSCKLEAQKPFDLDKAVGVWYKLFSMSPASEEGKCIKTTIFTTGKAKVVKAVSTKKDFLSGESDTETGVLTQNGLDGNLVYKVSSYLGEFDIAGEIVVLKAVVDKWAIIYTGVEGKTPSEKEESLWVMGREKKLTPEDEKLIEDAMKSISACGGPSYSDLKPSIQDDC